MYSADNLKALSLGLGRYILAVPMRNQKDEIVATYGADRAKKMICALTRDKPIKVCRYQVAWLLKLALRSSRCAWAPWPWVPVR